MRKLTFLILIFLLISRLSFSQYDIPPESVGGIPEAKRILSEAFCKSNISPNQIKTGKVTLTFIVNSDQSIDSLKFAKSVNAEVDKEIERVFPVIQWLPALNNSEPVSAWHLFEFRVNNKFYENSELCEAAPFDKVYQYSALNDKPDFLWGDFDKWVKSKLEYPDIALKKGIEGAVLTRFVIEKNGQLSNLGIAQSVGGGCDEEALRVIKLSKWQAGKKDGEAVRTQVYYQITFKTGKSDFKAIQSGDMIRGQ